MVMGWVGCREGDNGDARGDETRGRFVLIANDMTRFVSVVSERTVEETAGGCGSAMRPRKCVGYSEG
jgi:hypothetical protein